MDHNPAREAERVSEVVNPAPPAKPSPYAGLPSGPYAHLSASPYDEITTNPYAGLTSASPSPP